jgi:ribonuclease P protein component
MTPPGETSRSVIAEAPVGPPAVSLCASPATDVPLVLETLKTRPEFLRAASARRQGAGSFLVQARDRGDGLARVQVGITASKKIGNAVARNRAKRRLRALARQVLPALAQPGWDYVLVARPGVTITRLFADLVQDLEAALRQIHKTRP